MLILSKRQPEKLDSNTPTSSVQDSRVYVNFLDPVVGVMFVANAAVILTLFCGRRSNSLWRTAITIRARQAWCPI